MTCRAPFSYRHTTANEKGSQLPKPRMARGEDGDEPDTAPENAAAEPRPDAADEPPVEVNADDDDPGLLEQVADAVGDLWGDPSNGESA
jgi:hypothetical protein